MAKGTLTVRVIGDTKPFQKAMGKVSGIAKGAGLAAAAGFAAVGAAAVGASVKGLSAFADLERGMNEVFTLLPGISEDAMGQMTQQVRDFSKEFGVLPEETVPALYQALSAGVPQDNVFEFLETAQKAALGGVTELETAVDGISSVVNAYGEEVIDAEKASDLMFTAVRLGKTNFEELSASLFNVNPIASALGVSFEDVTAGLAAMTAQGTPTAQATTQMRQLLVELSKEGSKAAGVFEDTAGKSFQEFIDAGGNVEGALNLMLQSSEDSGTALQDMFGSVEAGQAALSLAGSEKFSDALDEMGDSAGATDAAFEQMDQGLGRTWDKIKSTFNDALLEVGERLAPFAEQFGEWFADEMPGIIDGAIDAFQGVVDWWQANGPAIVATVKTTFDVISTVIGSVVGVIQTVIGWFQQSEAESTGAFAKIRAFAEETWPQVQEIITGVVEVIRTVIEKVTAVMGALWEQHGERILKVAEAVWSNIKIVIQTVLGVIKGIIDVVMGALTGDWDRAWDGIKGIVSSVWDGIKGILGNLVTMVKNVIPIALDVLQEAFEFVWRTTVGVVRSAWEDIKSSIRGGIDTVVGWFADLPGRIGRAISGLFDGIKTAFRSAINWVIDKWNNWSFSAGFNIPDLFGGGRVEIGFDTPNIPRLHQGGIFNAPTPGGEGLALLQDRETVLPPGAAAGAVYNVTVNAGMGTNGDQIGRQIIDAIKRFERSNGPAWRT